MAQNHTVALNYGLILLVGLVPILVSMVWMLIATHTSTDLVHRSAFHSDKKLCSSCENGYFCLPGLENCHPVLDCTSIKEDIVMKEIVGKGAVKLVKRGVWLGHDVAVNLLANPAYREDFLHGLHMLRQLRSKVNVTQIVGFCEQNNIFVTELHPLGSADHLEAIFLKEYFRILDTLSVRFALCEQYVNILRSLHDYPDGARVMCDSNDVKKTLSQFLLRDDVTLILNDVDALPLVDKTHGKLIKCGHHELFGTFVAPEQLWPHEDRDFNDTEMLGYDEKVDIWKIPDVCDAFLGHVEGSARLRLQLLPVHLKCKSVDPTHRPSARDVQEVYERVREKLNLLLS